MTVTVPATAFLLYKLSYTSDSRRNCEPARNLTLINILIKTYVRLRAVCLQVFHSLPLPVLPSRVLQCVSSLISDLSTGLDKNIKAHLDYELFSNYGDKV